MIYIVLSILVMVTAIFSPILWLLVSKVPKRGTAFLLIAITGIIYFVTGECTWVIVASCVVSGILAEFVRKLWDIKILKMKSYLPELFALDLFVLLCQCGYYKNLI